MRGAPRCLAPHVCRLTSPHGTSKDTTHPHATDSSWRLRVRRPALSRLREGPSDSPRTPALRPSPGHPVSAPSAPSCLSSGPPPSGCTCLEPSAHLPVSRGVPRPWPSPGVSAARLHGAGGARAEVAGSPAAWSRPPPRSAPQEPTGPAPGPRRGGCGQGLAPDGPRASPAPPAVPPGSRCRERRVAPAPRPHLGLRPCLSAGGLTRFSLKGKVSAGRCGGPRPLTEDKPLRVSRPEAPTTLGSVLRVTPLPALRRSRRGSSRDQRSEGQAAGRKPSWGWRRGPLRTHLKVKGAVASCSPAPSLPGCHVPHAVTTSTSHASAWPVTTRSAEASCPPLWASGHAHPSACDRPSSWSINECIHPSNGPNSALPMCQALF